MGKSTISTISMAIFNSYASLPDGINYKWWFLWLKRRWLTDLELVKGHGMPQPWAPISGHFPKTWSWNHRMEGQVAISRFSNDSLLKNEFWIAPRFGCLETRWKCSISGRIHVWFFSPFPSIYIHGITLGNPLKSQIWCNSISWS